MVWEDRRPVETGGQERWVIRGDRCFRGDRMFSLGRRVRGDRRIREDRGSGETWWSRETEGLGFRGFKVSWTWTKTRFNSNEMSISLIVHTSVYSIH